MPLYFIMMRGEKELKNKAIIGENEGKNSTQLGPR
jgi:hypothetical protein